MKTLAIDTSSKRCSVCLLEDNNVLIDLYNDDEKTHSVKLMPMIDKALKTTNLTLDNIDLLSCSVGPGSFTGVRIGIATVKSFADVKNIPIVGISSLEILAFNVKDLALSSSTLICSLIDAKHDNVYCGLYYFKDDKCNLISMLAEDINTTIDKIHNEIADNKFDNIIFVGAASKIYFEQLSSFKDFCNIHYHV